MRQVVEQADVVIIGGGVIGSSIAWNLRQEGFRGRIVVVERDPTYRRASSYNATRGIRHQDGAAPHRGKGAYNARLSEKIDAERGRPPRPPGGGVCRGGGFFF